MNFNADKNRRVTNRFLALGAAAGIVGIIATDPDLVNSALAQSIGITAAVLATVGVVGAAWKFAEKQDILSGKTIASEFADIKEGFNNILAKIRHEFDDEFATNQGLDNKTIEPVKVKIK